ncbi:O-methyltransferase [Trema orientale]|uniref:O-methyltransferase n=1 Tax=Trema orientale TaxID=63057 RepID=A0A2P5EGI1_TREOI|nr:O-methyltransferase [Trema orientale]
MSLAPMLLMENHPWQMAPWHNLGGYVRDGGIAFVKTHSCELWNFAFANPEFNQHFDDAMACVVQMVIGAILKAFNEDADSYTLPQYN